MIIWSFSPKTRQRLDRSPLLVGIPAVTASCDAFTYTDDRKDAAKASAGSWWALTSIRTAYPGAFPTEVILYGGGISAEQAKALFGEAEIPQ